MTTFDGPNKLIILDPGTTSITAPVLYSEWKDWMMIGTNSRFLPAFGQSVGGEPIGGGQLVGSFFFIQNGWRIRPQEASHTLIITGNLFPVPDNAAVMAPTVGSYNVIVSFARSSISTTTVTGSVAQDDITAIKQLVEDNLDAAISTRLAESTLITGSKTPGTIGSALQDMAARITGAL